MSKEEKKESIKFLCKYIVYDNGLGFKIINGIAMTPDKGERICKCSIKGKLYDTKEFDELFVTGTWSEHPQYGRSFDVEAYVKVVPKNAKSMRIYLEQGNIKGINDKRAKLIVDKFGDNTFDVLLYQTGLLKTIKGIGEKSIEKIKISAVEKLKEQQMMSSIMSYIQNFHISPAYAKKIYEHYGLRSVEVLKKNPYQLAEDIQGIGFLKADEIALNNGIEKDSPMRVESAVLYTLKQMNDEGDVFGFYDDVKKQCKEFLNIDEKSIETSISNLVRKNKIKEESEALYPVQLYRAETESAKKITKLIYSESTKRFDITDEEIEKIEKKVNIKYAEGQKEAIKTVGRSNIMILTGGPGTGKTTVVNGIIDVCIQHKLKVLCAAPTGRAAKRMSEATGMEAMTIHKLLEVKSSPEVGGFKFIRNEKYPLDGDILIIDESSMIDMLLLNSLMKAVPAKMKIVFVGDIDQLPSVGCGNVLNELISSNVMPVVRLQVIFRQDEQSDIKQNAYFINNGIVPSLKNNKDSDFFFLDTGDMSQEQIRDSIVEYVCDKLPKYYNVSIDDVQVLAPMRKGATGVYELNDFIQNRVNPPYMDRPVIVCNDHLLRIGDRVMMTRNDYDNQVFNGDVGKITKIHLNTYEDDDNNNCFFVDFDGNEVKFDLNRSDDFVLAYATTIHKSQGSEYPIVVMPLTMSNFVMLQRNLLYTGVTRAKKVFVLFGQKKAVAMAVKTLKVVERNTRLGARIAQEHTEVSFI